MNSLDLPGLREASPNECLTVLARIGHRRVTLETRRREMRARWPGAPWPPKARDNLVMAQRRRRGTMAERTWPKGRGSGPVSDMLGLKGVPLNRCWVRLA